MLRRVWGGVGGMHLILFHSVVVCHCCAAQHGPPVVPFSCSANLTLQLENAFSFREFVVAISVVQWHSIHWNALPVVLLFDAISDDVLSLHHFVAVVRL